MTSILTPSQAKHIKGAGKTAARSKYGAKVAYLDGIRFASGLERDYYARLLQRERAGEVYGIKRQPEFILHTPTGAEIGKAIFDFAFWDSREDRFRVVDTKGYDNALSKWKRRHAEAEYQIRVEIVGKGGL